MTNIYPSGKERLGISCVLCRRHPGTGRMIPFPEGDSVWRPAVVTGPPIPNPYSTPNSFFWSAQRTGSSLRSVSIETVFCKVPARMA